MPPFRIYLRLRVFLAPEEQGRRAQHGLRAIWTVQHQLEREANAERALAQAERDTVVAKVCAAEQEALQTAA